MTLLRFVSGWRRCRARDFRAWAATGAFAIWLVAASPAFATIYFNPASLPFGTQGVAYNQMIVANDGDSDDTTGPFDSDDLYTYSVTTGALPPGLNLNFYNGNLTGTPTTPGSYTFTVTATDQSSPPDTGTQTYTVVIGGNALTLTPATLPNATQGANYNQTVTASGGSGSYTYSVSAGSLPAGLSLNPSTGAITGVPTGSGPASFTIEAIDQTNGNYGTQAYNVNVGTNALTLNPASLPNATKGAAYSQTVTASGGTGPYTYAVTSGALPAGLSLNASTGVISGTPTGTGASGFTIGAQDSAGNTGSRAYSINIGTNSLTINPTSLPAATNGVAYAQTVSASGGTAPYTYTISAGALPAGLSLNASTGAITGTPTGGGIANFTVGVADGNGNVGSRAYTVSTGTNTLAINPASLPAAVQGTPYNQIVSASGGSGGPYTYAIIAGALPPGLTFNTTSGAISGTPTTIGSFSVTIQARDANGNIGSRAYAAMAVRPNPASDPDVQGLIAAQAATARRFATTQVSNVATHLETLHEAFDPCLVNGGIGVTVYDPVSGLPVDPTAANPANPAGKGTQVGPPKCDASNIFSFGFWGGGNVQIGSGSLNGQSNRFSSDGVTFGADGRIADNLIIGVAAGYGTDSTNIGADGTSNAAQNFDATLYASYRPFDHWFLDAVAGYGTLNFSSQRFVAFDGTMAGGTRTGSDWFGSVILTSEIKQGPLTVAPYLRADIVSTSLDGYAEQGSSLALTYGAVGFNAAAGVFGVRALYDIDTAWGVIAPMARLEYRRELDGGFNQSMFYTDLGAGQAYVLNEPDMSLNLFTGTLGFRARAGANLSAQFEYGLTGGANSLLVQSLRGTLRIGF